MQINRDGGARGSLFGHGDFHIRCGKPGDVAPAMVDALVSTMVVDFAPHSTRLACLFIIGDFGCGEN